MIPGFKIGFGGPRGGCERKLENGLCANVDAVEEPNDSERFISGGERSEETVRRWLGGVLWSMFAMAQSMRAEFVRGDCENGGCAAVFVKSRQQQWVMR
jgi:hypothetical protein